MPLSTQWPGDKVGGTIQDAVIIWKSRRAPALVPEVPQGSGGMVLTLVQSLPLYRVEPRLRGAPVICQGAESKGVDC